MKHLPEPVVTIVAVGFSGPNPPFLLIFATGSISSISGNNPDDQVEGLKVCWFSRGILYNFDKVRNDSGVCLSRSHNRWRFGMREWNRFNPVAVRGSGDRGVRTAPCSYR